MQFELKIALREKDVTLLDELVDAANEAERRAGGMPAHTRETMLGSIGTLGLVEEHTRRRLNPADRPVVSATEVEYGRTFNLGNYESERIGMRLPVEAGAAPQAVLDQARRWVEQQHQQGEEVRRLEQRLADLSVQLRSRERDLEQLKTRLGSAAQVYEQLYHQVKQQGGRLTPLHVYLLPTSEAYIAACNRLHIALHASIGLAEWSFALLSTEASPEEVEQLRAALETVRRVRGEQLSAATAGDGDGEEQLDTTAGEAREDDLD